ncbi:MAG: glycerophosphodiester phosphodiesterase family protein [Cellvibrionaceae bacterium]
MPRPLLYSIAMALLASAAAADTVQLGLRPYLLVKDMDNTPLKHTLESCASGPFQTSDFSIGHRGVPLGYPEHTEESYRAAARMGAGIVECDVTFTSDKALVCRHSQCDLHTTTNILATEMARSCRQPFQPAVLNTAGEVVSPATATCCTSDITVAEFKTLQGKQDGFNPNAVTVADYLQLNAGGNTGTLLTHRESIALFQQLNVKMTPELKSPEVAMPFKGMGQTDYARKMIDHYKEAGVAPSRVWPQSFNLDDVLYWIEHEPDFGRQAVYLDDRDSDSRFNHRDPDTWNPNMEQLVASGVNIIAPPIWMLLEAEGGQIVPSTYAKAAQAAGLDIIAWTLERSGSLREGGGWYYQTLNGDKPNQATGNGGVINREGDVMRVMDVLAREVNVTGIFSDWPATVTYYANCMSLE